MEATLKVQFELGPITVGLINQLAGQSGKTTAPVAAPAKQAETPVKPIAEEKPKVEKPVAAPAKQAEKASFEDLDDDAKLEAIKTEVTRHTKKGKSGDIKTLLTHFEAGRASELNTEHYAEFYAAILRYGKGETVEAITGGSDDLA